MIAWLTKVGDRVPIFLFSADSYIAMVLVSIAVFAIFYAASTWAFSEVRTGRIGRWSILLGFVLPAQIPVLIQFIATVGLLFQARLGWTRNSWVVPFFSWHVQITPQATDVILAYLFLALVFAILPPAFVVLRLGWKDAREAEFKIMMDRYMSTH
jgi:hypothetical protein